MKKKLLNDPDWVGAVTVALTDGGRWLATAPGGLVGWGRTREQAVSACAESAGPKAAARPARPARRRRRNRSGH